MALNRITETRSVTVRSGDLSVWRLREFLDGLPGEGVVTLRATPSDRPGEMSTTTVEVTYTEEPE